MPHKNQARSELKIDQSRMKESDSGSATFLSRMMNAVYAIVLGIVLVQVFYFLYRSGSVVHLAGNVFFLSYLGVCAAQGWVFGANFTSWLKDEIGNWWP